jgi:hypothetical protein
MWLPQVLLCRNESRTVDVLIDTLHDGGFFGENALLTSNPRNASVRSLCHCDLMVLELEGLQQVMAEFPDFARRIQTVSTKRNQETVLTSGKQKWRGVLNRLKKGGKLIERVKAVAENFQDPDEQTAEEMKCLFGGAAGPPSAAAAAAARGPSSAGFCEGNVQTGVLYGGGGPPLTVPHQPLTVPHQHLPPLLKDGCVGSSDSDSSHVTCDEYLDNPPAYPCASPSNAAHRNGPPAEAAHVVEEAVLVSPSSPVLGASAAALRVAAMMAGGDEELLQRPTMFFENARWNSKGGNQLHPDVLASPLFRRSRRNPEATARSAARSSRHWMDI